MCYVSEGVHESGVGFCLEGVWRSEWVEEAEELAHEAEEVD